MFQPHITNLQSCRPDLVATYYLIAKSIEHSDDPKGVIKLTVGNECADSIEQLMIMGYNLQLNIINRVEGIE